MRRVLVLASALVFLALGCEARPAQADVAHVDRSFGDQGALMLSSRLEEVSETTMLADGRIVIAGHQRILALLPSGRVDTGFGEAGFAPLNLPAGATSASIATVAVDGQGGLVVGGNSSPPTRLLVERFTPSGQLDRSFGGGGFLSTDLGLPPPTRTEPPTVLARSAVLDGQGRIVLSGVRLAGSYIYKGFTLGRYEAFFTRFSGNGDVDTSFGSGGVLRLPDAEGAGAPVADGRAGVYFASGGNLVHLGDDGRVDPGFGQDGGRPRPKGTDSNPVLDPLGRVLTYGYLQGSKEHRVANGLLIKRLLPDGSTDPSFGDDGAVVFRLPRLYTARVGVDAKGGVLIAAALKQRRQQGRHPALPAGLALARLRPGGSVDAGFGQSGVVSIPFRRNRDLTIEDLDVVGDAALLSGTWCGGGCGMALARFRLGSG